MLASAAALTALVAVVQWLAPRIATGTFDADPGIRALGLVWAIVAWMLWLSARLTATGTRRLLGRVAAIGFFVAAATRIAGSDALADVDAVVPARSVPGARALVAAIAVGLCAAFVYFTSPARRR